MIGDDVVVIAGDDGRGVVVTPQGGQTALSAVPAGAVLAQTGARGHAGRRRRRRRGDRPGGRPAAGR